MKMHFMLGNGVRCNYLWEAPDATDDWGKVTCRNCLRLHAATLEQSLRHLQGRLARQSYKPPRFSKEAMEGRLVEYTTKLTIIKSRLQECSP